MSVSESQVLAWKTEYGSWLAVDILNGTMGCTTCEGAPTAVLGARREWAMGIVQLSETEKAIHSGL